MLCRIRVSGPIPGKNPKNVGDELSAKLKRLPCSTKAPPVVRFRMANGPDVVFATPTDGTSFQLRWNSTGRLKAVCQSTAVEKSPGNVCASVTESAGSGDAGSSTPRETTCRAVVVRSMTLMVLLQLKLPNRNGVARLMVLLRELPTCDSVSSEPSGRTTTTSGSGVRDVSSLRRVNPGDQVMFRAMSSGFGARSSDGRVDCELLSVRFCRRVAPSVICPQRNRRVRFAELLTSWVLRRGSSALSRTTKLLLT